MVNPLVGAHAFLGEAGVIAFIWVFVELLNPAKERVKRAQLVALLGVIFLFLSWIVGGYYYVQYYGENVKPVIKSGPQSWAHGIFMETKEHVFLFLPFIALLTLATLKKYEVQILRDKKARRAVLALCILILVIGALMGFMGYLISTGARTALEAGA